MNLAAKYRPAHLDDVVEQPLVTTMLKSMCEEEELTNRNFLLIGPAGTGKAQPLYSKILTPNGYIQMKDVQVGTNVFTHTGAVAPVSAIYPQGVRPIYEITLQDRTKIRVSDEHLNVVYRYNEDRKCREDYTLTTTELIKLFETSRFKLRVDIPEVDWDEAEVPVDPYLLGILIADGSLYDNFGVSNPEEDICAKVDSKLREIGWYLKEAQLDHDMCLIDVDHSDHTTRPFKQALKDMGMLVKSVDKHIPKEYLMNSREVRLQLLQGLFDGDGHIHGGGSVEYTTSSPQLSEDFAFLVRSLGIRDTVCASVASYRDADGNKVDCQIAYTHHLKIPNGLPFYSSIKHCNRYKDSQNAPIRDIVSIEYVGMEECQCIMIDHPDHTYLSDDMIPTHNTTSARAMANLLNKGEGEPIEIDAASHSGVDAMRDIVQQARSYPVGCKYKVFIIDECFPGNTWVNTPSGKIQIKDIHPGDRVYNLTGQATVTKVLHNRVKSKNLISLRVGSKQIITTQDHLFFTNLGWVKARDLKEGDQLYDYKTLQSMQHGIPSTVSERFEANMQQGMQEAIHVRKNDRVPYKLISKNMSDMWQALLDSKECRCIDLLNELWDSLQEAESRYGQEVGATCKTLAYIYLSGMWRAEGDKKQRSSNSLLKPMCFEDSIKESEKSGRTQNLHMVWEFILGELRKSSTKDMQQGMQIRSNCSESCREAESEIIGIHEDSQSYGESSNSSQDDRDSTEEWDITLRSCDSWWKWSICSASDSFERSIGTFVDARVSCDYSHQEGQQSESLSYELQARPSVSRITSGDRGGWCRPQYEISTIVRREESEMLEQLRVDSIEIYKQGDNDELFSGSFSSDELHQECVDMYDLEINGHPSYFVNDVLAHNCHSISSAGWQVLLKTLEENPAKSVFLLSTTNPEKIPATILSRVQTFQLSKISLDGINKRLIHILEEEKKEGRKITYSPEAVNYIAKLANGGMRDAITLLDKALAFSEDVSSDNVYKALNLPSYDDYFLLLNAIAKKDNKSIAEIIHKVYNSGVNFTKWFEGFHAFICNIVKYIFLQDINATMIPSHYQDKISKYGVAHSTLCLKLANKLLKLNQELKSTQYLQEVALTYLCTPPKKGE